MRAKQTFISLTIYIADVHKAKQEYYENVQ